MGTEVLREAEDSVGWSKAVWGRDQNCELRGL